VGRAYPICAAFAAAAAAITAAVATADQPLREAKARHEVQSTQLISRSIDGGTPNGPSTNAVISQDRRWARYIAFESEATNLVRGDTNGVKDVFVVRRSGQFHNNGSRWMRGKTTLISRGPQGPANGPSWGAAVDGSFWSVPSCVAFLSSASNLVAGDTNGKVDAFVSQRVGSLPKRVSPPGATEDTTEVAVSGDCSRIAFVTGGKLYVKTSKKVRQIRAGVPIADPSFSNGFSNDLVFTAPAGVYMSRGGTKKPKLIGPGGRNPAYSDIHKPPPNCKRRTFAYERRYRGRWQIVVRVQGQKTRVISRRRASHANGDSRKPVIGNAGCYVTFESDASNLGLNATGRKGDHNQAPDVYLYTAVRRITLVQSVRHKAIPTQAGARNPSMSWYANYIVFDSKAPLQNQFRLEPWQFKSMEKSTSAAQYEDPMPPEQKPPADNRQVYMRYLGPV
jgi:hypothetical protein